MVIVQPHLLRDKGKVRLRRIQFESVIAGNTAGCETFVSLENLAATISSYTVGEAATIDYSDVASQRSFQTLTTTDMTNSMAANLDCIYVDNDQYFESEKQVSKSDTPNWKSILKTIKAVALRTESYLESLLRSSHGPPTAVIGANVSFWVLRDFGTCLMRRAEATAYGASGEITEKYPKCKKVLKTLASAIDSVMKKNGFWSSRERTNHGALATLLLYSKIDDRFDLVSLGDGVPEVSELHNDGSGRKGRRDRRRGGDDR